MVCTRSEINNWKSQSLLQFCWVLWFGDLLVPENREMMWKQAPGREVRSWLPGGEGRQGKRKQGVLYQSKLEALLPLETMNQFSWITHTEPLCDYLSPFVSSTKPPIVFSVVDPWKSNDCQMNNAHQLLQVDLNSGSQILKDSTQLNRARFSTNTWYLPG